MVADVLPAKGRVVVTTARGGGSGVNDLNILMSSDEIKILFIYFACSQREEKFIYLFDD